MSEPKKPLTKRLISFVHPNKWFEALSHLSTPGNRDPPPLFASGELSGPEKEKSQIPLVTRNLLPLLSVRSRRCPSHLK